MPVRQKSLTKGQKQPPITAGEFFLDSGAHSLYNIHARGKPARRKYDYFTTPEFWEYVDEYAAFVKKRAAGLDYYATVDVIFNPKLSWKVLKYLEQEHGLSPVPVIHYGTPMKWIERHVDAGYEFLGIGGLGQEAQKVNYLAWADQVFKFLCPPPSRLPIVRTHGFAMTAYSLLIRYPWWSVDSSSWAKAAGFGGIYVPQKRGGRFTFSVPPYSIGISNASPKVKIRGQHYHSWTPLEKAIVQEWLEKIGVPFGKVNAAGEPVEYGVLSQYNARAVANLKFFEELCEGLPKYPWPFKVKSHSIKAFF